jgi:hypothetical protein
MLKFLGRGILALVDDLPSEAERDAMRSFLRDGAAARKTALFACACCRQIWPSVSDPRSRAAVEAAEQVADGLIGEGEAQQIAFASHAARNEVGAGRSGDWAEVHIRRVAANACWECVSAVLPARGFGASVAAAAQDAADVAAWSGLSATLAAARAQQAALLRDVFGSPFHPARFDSRWRSVSVTALARGIYQEERFDRLPILADALVDAGCDDADILVHCRSKGPHVRGCWVVDKILALE